MTKSGNSLGQVFIASLFLACALMASYLIFARPASSSALPNEAKVTALTADADNVATEEIPVTAR